MGPETRFLVTDRFHVDRRSESLVVADQVVPLHHRTYQVLLALMARPRELVTKRELFESIWGTLEVSDAVLTTAIKELRQALGDDARAPWAIATVHARGYRFLLRVHPSDTLRPSSEAEKQGAGAKRSSRIGLVAILATITILLVFALFPGQRHTDGPPARSAHKSIAVLPFNDLSKAGDDKWFADGLAEEILNSLTRSKDLLVAARTSSFRYGGGGGGVDIREVGKALNVTHVMEGSVRRGADQLRVTAQLIRADDGFHVWSKTYDIPVDTDNALSLQRSIAEDVLLMLKADGAEVSAAGQEGGIQLDTYERYLRGRQLVQTRRPDAVLEGLDELNMVVRLAPAFAPGHAWLACAYLFSTQFSGRPIVESMTAAEFHVRRAMELDPDGSDPLTAAALLELARRDSESALEFANRAVAANPSHVPSLRRRGVIYLTLGRVAEAHQDFVAVRARDPLSPISLAHVAATYSILNDKERALQAAEEGVRWNPDDSIANNELGRILADTGEYVEAIEYLERAVEINPEASLSTLRLASLYWEVGLDDRLNFAEPPMVWNGLAAAAISSGDFDRGLQLAKTFGIGSTGALVSMHVYHWYGDPELAYPPAMRLASRNRLADGGLSHNYRTGAIPVLLALEANGDEQADRIRENLSALFQDKRPGDFAFANDIYGAASWQMVNGNQDEAMAWLQDALDRGFIFRALHLDPIWDPIRETPEFQSILADSDRRAESVRTEYLAGESGKGSDPISSQDAARG